MKVMFIGNFYGNRGPANANNSFVSGLGTDEAIISRGKSKPARIIEAMLKVPRSDAVCICSASRLNYFLIKICRLFHKNMYYIIHGNGSYEYRINAVGSFDQRVYDETHNYERVMYESAKAVICVSIKLMELMKERESDIAFKFRYAHFGFDFEKVEEEVCDGDVYRDSAMCITVGGGSPRKNNIPVCEAIKRLNDGGMDLKLTIIGYSLEFGEKLRSYDFVTYYELLPHQDVIRLMKGSALYIQNSIFDSFSIAVMESIGCGCSVLISSGTGASESLSTIESSDIVYDTYNVGEIAEKIKYLVEHPNASRIRAGIDAASCSDRVASRRLYELLAELEKEG